MARHTASSHGDTPILIQTWFSHLNAYASTYAQYPNEYANLAFPSSLALSAASDPRSRRAVHTQPQERRRKTEVRAREKQTRREKDNTRASDSKHVTQVSPDHHDQEKRAESRDKREESSSHGDTPILIQTWFSHLNACPGQAAATEARSEKRETRSPKWLPEIHKLSDSKVC